MVSFFWLILILYFQDVRSSSKLFSIQETLTILCRQFPLVSTVNNSDLQCALVRINEGIPTFAFELKSPSQIDLFIIIDLSLLSNISPVDITIDFGLLPNISSSIKEIRLGLLVTTCNFTVNNQTTAEYTPNEIPIFRWQNSTENTYDLVDILQIENGEYENDKSLCRWDINRWNRLFNGSISNNVSYAYFLKTTNPQLTFTFADMTNISLLPSPYLNILYCISYKLEVTEIVILICSSTFFTIMVIILCILHYFKGGDNNRARHLERYYHHHHRRDSRDRVVRSNTNIVRYRASTSVSIVAQDD